MRSRILLIEDDPDIRSGVAEILSMEGYDVLTARDGMEGWSLVQSETGIRAILLDYTMPKLDARGFRDLQKSQPVLDQIPVILFSAAALPKDTLDSLGVREIIRKPMDLDVLIDTIKKHA